MIAGIRSVLAAYGVDLKLEIGRGALMLSSDQSHLINGKFDTERMITHLGDAVRQALADGYTGLWAAGDMTWEFGNEENLSKLLEYEQQLDIYMQNNPALCGVCLYHCNTLPAHAIQTAMATHFSCLR